MAARRLCRLRRIGRPGQSPAPAGRQSQQNGSNHSQQT
jgi:hypothetical protein